MTDLLSNLLMGFHVAANPYNVLFCLLGALVGTLVGVLPGIGTVATIAMLLPITFGLPPVGALIMLAGIYYGAQYGGSTTSVLVNIPGEATSVITCLDGHQMARQGRAGPALSIAAIGSFFAGCVATVLVADLGDGIGFANIAMGVFGFAEIIRNLELPPESRDILKTKITNLMPTRQDLIDSAGAIARGTALGSLVGILPGGGAVIASFAAYTFEKKISKDPSRFGRGAIQGVA